MPLTSEEAYPIPGLKFLLSLWLPSQKQTEEARQELAESNEKDFVFATHPLTQEFAEGKLNIGTRVRIDGRDLVLKGVYPKAEYPYAMVFWDAAKRCHVQFHFLPSYSDFEIDS